MVQEARGGYHSPFFLSPLNGGSLRMRCGWGCCVWVLCGCSGGVLWMICGCFVDSLGEEGRRRKRRNKKEKEERRGKKGRISKRKKKKEERKRE